MRGSIFGLFLKKSADQKDQEYTTELDPRTFAARLGAVAASASFVLFFADYTAWSFGIAIGIAAFSLSDVLFKKCFGSEIYLRFLKPYFDKMEKGLVREWKETALYKALTVLLCIGFFPLLYLLGHFLAK